jgi:hypothetical protein
MAGSPAQPGGSPVLAPGGGAGNMAAASGILKSVIPSLHQALQAFPVNSPQYKAVDRALAALTPTFGQQQGQNLVPAAILQQAQAAKSGQSPISNAMPPLQPAPPPGASASPAGGGGGDAMAA